MLKTRIVFWSFMKLQVPWALESKLSHTHTLPLHTCAHTTPHPTPHTCTRTHTPHHTAPHTHLKAVISCMLPRKLSLVTLPNLFASLTKLIISTLYLKSKRKPNLGCVILPNEESKPGGRGGHCTIIVVVLALRRLGRENYHELKGRQLQSQTLS